MKRITFVVPDELNSRLSFIGLGHSGHHDTAQRIDEILAEEWDDAGGR